MLPYVVFHKVSHIVFRIVIHIVFHIVFFIVFHIVFLPYEIINLLEEVSKRSFPVKDHGSSSLWATEKFSLLVGGPGSNPPSHH